MRTDLIEKQIGSTNGQGGSNLGDGRDSPRMAVTAADSWQTDVRWNQHPEAMPFPEWRGQAENTKV
jgi:hypothetical protein